MELGIDRSLVEPIKFVSSIDSKPIYPPYLQLADFDSFLKRDADGNNNPGAGGTDKKKDGNEMGSTRPAKSFMGSNQGAKDDAA